MIKMATCVEIWRYKQDGFSQAETARELQINRRTVSKYWNKKPEDIKPIKRHRLSKLTAIASVVEELYRVHRNCDVVAQELNRRGYEPPSLRQIQRFTGPLRDQMNKERRERAKVRRRVETLPGEYMQIDFGVENISIAGVITKIHFFVAVLAYSRRRYVAWFDHEDSDAWLRGIEGAFKHFGGTPRSVVCDNARPLVKRATKPSRSLNRHFEPNERYWQFCNYWGVKPITCIPYYPQSKGKVENAVRYVKQNCLAGYSFDDMAQLQERLDYWMDEVADKKEMQLPTGERIIPAERFEEKKKHLLPCRPTFLRIREVWRKVDAKGMLVIDSSRYQLPLDLSNKEVAVYIEDSDMIIRYQGNVVAKLNKALDVVKVNMIASFTAENFHQFGATVDDGIFGSFEECSGHESITLSGEFLEGYILHKNNPLDRPANYYDQLIGENW